MKATATLTAVLAVLLFPGIAAAEDLVLQKAKIRYALDRCSLSLTADLSGDGPRSFLPGTDGITFSIGSDVIVSLPPVDDRASWKTKGLWKHCYLEKRSDEREGVRRVTLDFGKGRIKLRAKHLSLNNPPEDNVITMTLVVAGHVYTATETFRGDRTLKFKCAWKGTPNGPNVGYNPPGPIDRPPLGTPVDFGHLMSTGAPVGDGSSSVTQQRFARDGTEWYEIWKEFFGKPWPPIPIDHSQETGVAFLLGSRPGYNYIARIVSATELDGVVTVRWREETPGDNCYTTPGGPYNVFWFMVLKTKADKVVFEQVPTVKYRCY